MTHYYLINKKNLSKSIYNTILMNNVCGVQKHTSKGHYRKTPMFNDVYILYYIYIYIYIYIIYIYI